MAMVVLLVAMAFRPSFYGYANNQAFTNVDIFLVVDSTISMMAEDYKGGGVRLDGVKSDIRGLTEHFAGARFSLVTFANTATPELPLTTDTTAVNAAAETIFVPDTYRAGGSDIGVAAEELTALLTAHKDRGLNRSRLVFYFGDGENNSNNRTSFSGLKNIVSGGAVFGYGTESGGKMINQREAYNAQMYNRKVYESSKYVRDYSAFQPAISKASYENLDKIASELGIKSFKRNDGGSVGDLMKDFRFERSHLADDGAVAYAETYYLLAIIFLILVVLEWRTLFLHYRRIKQSSKSAESEP